VRKFLKDNFVLIVGLTLPVVLMAGFLALSALPRSLSDPPRHDLIFAVPDYSVPPGRLSVAVRFIVEDGVLTAQYTRVAQEPGGYYGGGWKKLYRYEAGWQTVRELPFPIPDDVASIASVREDVVAATKDLKLDTSARAPDGYELEDRTNRGGLLTDIFWRRSASEPRLRKGASSVPLRTGDGRTAFYAGNIEFIGWVVGAK